MSEKTQWDELLEELNAQQETLNKSLNADQEGAEKDDQENEDLDGDGNGEGSDGNEDDEDAQIAALANGDADDDGVNDDEDEDELLGKSLSVTTDDGKQMEAYDATELVKSLMAGQKEIGQQVRVISGQTGMLIKALAETVKAKDEEVKALRGDVSMLQKAVINLAGKGRGRRTLLTIHDRADASQDGQQPTSGELLQKANSAAEAGRISWREYAGVETSLRMQQPIDESLLAKIAG